MARRLRTSTEVLRYLEETADKLDNGEIDTDHSRAVTYLCNTASSTIKNLILEKKIEDLEALVEDV